MRHFARNTTAIVACLSILMPHVASAQSQQAQGAQVAPNTQSGDSNPDNLRDLLLKKQREADKKAAKQAEQKKEAKKDKKEQKPKGDKKKRAEEKAKADKKAQSGKPKGDRKDKDKQEAGNKAKDRRDRGPEKVRAEEQRKDAERRKQRQAEEQRSRKEAEQQRRKAEQRRADEAEKRREDDRRAEERRRAEEERRVDEDRARLGNRVRLEDSRQSRVRAEQMGRLDSVLDREIDGGLRLSQLDCLSGGSYPCANGGRVVTPGGVVLEPAGNGEYVMAGADRQIYRVDGDGDLVVRDTPVRDRRTLAAREAARGDSVSDLAALAGVLGGGNVYRQRVTDRDYRSSDEDFSTSLRDALDGRSRAGRDDDDDNDLTKALLLGLGALAVGSMLNNNRQVALSSPDRVVVTRPDGSQEVIRDDAALLRQPGSNVETQRFDDGSTRTVVTRQDGSRVVTIRDRDMRVLRRTLISPDGRTSTLIDDTVAVDPVDLNRLPAPVRTQGVTSDMDEEALRAALSREANIDRRFTLGQIRNIEEVRSLVAPVDIEAITFDSGSAAIRPTQAQHLARLGNVIHDAVAEDPQEMFLIEGYTDTVGNSAANLALSDRRAESVALALTEYYDVPPENLVVQGYGEQYLKVPAEGDVSANRRTAVRRITDLMHVPAASE